MNEHNYGSLEACKRLVEAGVFLKTEGRWSDHWEKEFGKSLMGNIIPAIFLPFSSEMYGKSSQNGLINGILDCLLYVLKVLLFQVM